MDLAEISFTVDGESYELSPPTPRLAFKANRLLGGVGTILDRCQQGDLDIYVALLKRACPKAPKGEEPLQDFVYANLHTVNFHVTQWAVALQWGGRLPQVPATADDAASADGPEGDGAAPDPLAPAASGESL